MILNENQKEIFNLRYAMEGETWSDRARKVAQHVAKAELNGDTETWEDEFYKCINEGYFIPGGRILYGCGRKNGMLLNCFSLGVEDNRYSIAEFLKNYYLTGVSGGGIGYDISKIRPKGAPIQNIPGAARGVLSEIRKIDMMGEEIFCGGSRVIAMMASLSIEHPDIVEFIRCKGNDGKIKNHNISVFISRKFIEAVRKDEEWKFYFKGQEYFQHQFIRDDGEIFIVPSPTVETALPIVINYHKKDFTSTFDYNGIKIYRAKDIWNEIVTGATNNGEPGIIFIDNIKDNFATSYFEKFNSTNPCGEISLPSEGNCCLGSINLSSLYSDKKEEIDWSKLKKTIYTAVRFLDNVITVNDYPIPETEVVSKKSRRIGLGVMGLHYLLIKKEFKYGSEESLQYIERLFDTIRNETYIASTQLASEKGSFPEYDYENYISNQFIKRLPIRVRREIEKHGIRNAALLTIPPTGTTSMVVGVSSGIEPIYAPVRKEKFIENGVWKERVMVDNLFKEYYLEGKDLTNFVGSTEITPEEHLLVQTTIQERICQNISKTINIPSNYSDKDIGDLILSHSSDLKGVTIYRAGSRGMEPLQAIPLDSLSKEELDSLVRESDSGTEMKNCSGGRCDL